MKSSPHEDYSPDLEAKLRSAILKKDLKQAAKVMASIPLAAVLATECLVSEAEPGTAMPATETIYSIPDVEPTQKQMPRLPPGVFAEPPSISYQPQPVQPQSLFHLKPMETMTPEDFIAILQEKIAAQGRNVIFTRQRGFYSPSPSSADEIESYGGEKTHLTLRIQYTPEGKKKVLEATGTFPEGMEIPKW